MSSTTEAEAIRLANELTEDSRRASAHAPESPQNLGITVSGDTRPDIARFYSGGRCVLTICHDGRIDIPADIDPGEAGRVAAEMMGAQLATTIRAAVEAEREACAKEADEESRLATGDRGAVDAAGRCADRIRARGQR